MSSFGKKWNCGWKKISTETNDLELWIGCKDVDNTRKLICLGERGNPAYENWADGQPDNSNHECVRIAETFGGKWGDEGCDDQLKFVACEMEAVSCRRRPATSFNLKFLIYVCSTMRSRAIRSRSLLSAVLRAGRSRYAAPLISWRKPMRRSVSSTKQPNSRLTSPISSNPKTASSMSDIKKVRSQM